MARLILNLIGSGLLLITDAMMRDLGPAFAAMLSVFWAGFAALVLFIPGIIACQRDFERLRHFYIRYGAALLCVIVYAALQNPLWRASHAVRLGMTQSEARAAIQTMFGYEPYCCEYPNDVSNKPHSDHHYSDYYKTDPDADNGVFVTYSAGRVVNVAVYDLD